MEKIKKSVISGEFIIEIDKTGHVSVYRIYDNVIGSLREIYKTENLEFDPTWNTRQMGNNLIKKYCTDDDNTQAIIGDYLIQRRENGSIETFRDYGKGKVTEALKEVAQKVGLKVESGWNTQQLGSKLVDFIKDKPQNIYIMQEFKLDGRMTVSSMKELFKTLTGGTLRVKDGGKKADESATLAAIRKESDNKSGAFALNPEMTVGDFKAKMLSDYGLKVEVGTPDDWVSVPDGITLGQLRELPKNAVKAQLEALVVGGEKKTEKSNTQQDDTPQFEQSPDAARVEYSEDGTILKKCPTDFEGALIIPEGVKEIYQNAFDGCSKLTAVIMPDSITELNYISNDCTSLSYVKLPDTLKVLPAYYFEGSSVSTVILPQCLEQISNDAFKECKNLKEITIPASVKFIGDYAFSGCSSLEKVVFEGTDIEVSVKYVFDDCENLDVAKVWEALYGGKKMDITVNLQVITPEEIEEGDFDLGEEQHGFFIISAKDEDGEPIEYIYQAFLGLDEETDQIYEILRRDWLSDSELSDIKVYVSQPMTDKEIKYATQAYQYYFRRNCNFEESLIGPEGTVKFIYPNGNEVELHVTFDESYGWDVEW